MIALPVLCEQRDAVLLVTYAIEDAAKRVVVATEDAGGAARVHGRTPTGLHGGLIDARTFRP